jgi:predicted small secreted protein
MSRLLIVLAIAGLLAACSTGSAGSGQPAQSASDAASAAASGTVSGDPSAACAEAFAPIRDMNITSISDLGDVDEVTPTVEGCESVADWIAGVQQVLGAEVKPSTARLLLDIRCSDPSLDAPICDELASS